MIAVRNRLARVEVAVKHYVPEKHDEPLLRRRLVITAIDRRAALCGVIPSRPWVFDPTWPAKVCTTCQHILDQMDARARQGVE